jgi:hypothetical protein
MNTVVKQPNSNVTLFIVIFNDPDGLVHHPTLLFAMPTVLQFDVTVLHC